MKGNISFIETLIRPIKRDGLTNVRPSTKFIRNSRNDDIRSALGLQDQTLSSTIPTTRPYPTRLQEEIQQKWTLPELHIIHHEQVGTFATICDGQAIDGQACKVSKSGYKGRPARVIQWLRIVTTRIARYKCATHGVKKACMDNPRMHIMPPDRSNMGYYRFGNFLMEA